MARVVRVEAELGEDRVDVLAHRAFGDHQGRRDLRVGPALGHQREHVAFPLGQGVQRVPAAPAHQELCHHLGVERGAARGHPAQRVEELGHVGHPVLEQIADAAGVRRQQVGGVPLLHVLRQHEDGDVRPLGADHQGRPDALVGVRRGHPDVGDHQVGPFPFHGVEQRGRVTRRGRDLEPGAFEELDQAREQQHRVLADNHSQPHVFHATAPCLTGGITRRAAPWRPGRGRPSRPAAAPRRPRWPGRRGTAPRAGRAGTRRRS